MPENQKGGDHMTCKKTIDELRIEREKAPKGAVASAWPVFRSFCRSSALTLSPKGALASTWSVFRSLCRFGALTLCSKGAIASTDLFSEACAAPAPLRYPLRAR